VCAYVKWLFPGDLPPLRAMVTDHLNRVFQIKFDVSEPYDVYRTLFRTRTTAPVADCTLFEFVERCYLLPDCFYDEPTGNVRQLTTMDYY
jgi:hypothetical protein